MHHQFKNVELKLLLWKAACAITIDDFNQQIQAMKDINPRCVDWLLSTADPKYWAEVYFPGRRYGHLTSNLAESLNSWLLEAREMPVLSMFEKIRHQMMEWFEARRQLEVRVNTSGRLVMKAALIIQHSLTRAQRYNLVSATDIVFEIFLKKISRNTL